jgi:AbrB family looped-hinge helix DNA binding protein
MATAKVTSKGQITVPKGVRAKLGLAPGDELEFVEEEGQFVIRKRVRRSPFDRYLGYLARKRGQDPDDIVRELRGHE